MWEGRRLLDRLEDGEPDPLSTTSSGCAPARVSRTSSRAVAGAAARAVANRVSRAACGRSESSRHCARISGKHPAADDSRSAMAVPGRSPSAARPSTAARYPCRLAALESLHYAQPRRDQAPLGMNPWKTRKQAHRTARAHSAAGALADDRFSGPLPKDLVPEQLGRLAIFSLIGLSLWTIGLVIDQLVKVGCRPATDSEMEALVLEVIGIVVSARCSSTCATCRTRRRRRSTPASCTCS